MERKASAEPLRRPRALLFDLGDTILREEGYEMPAAMEALLAHGIESSESAQSLADGLRAEVRATRADGEREFRFADWLRARQRPGDPRTAEALERELWQGIARLRPMDGAGAALAELSRAGLAMGVVSNAMFAASTLASELERHGLLSPFRFVISSADVGLRKPHASIFEEALRRIGVAAHDAWFVGDRFEADVVGAQGVGMTAIWLSDSGAPPPAAVPHLRVRDWDELVALLRSAG